MTKFLFLSLLILILSLALAACGSAESGGAIPIKFEYAMPAPSVYSSGLAPGDLFSPVFVGHLLALS